MGNKTGLLKSICPHQETNVEISEHELIISITTYVQNGAFIATTAPTLKQMLETLHTAPSERNKQYNVALLLGMTLTHTQNPLPYDLILNIVMDNSLVDPKKCVINVPIHSGQKKLSLDLVYTYEDSVRNQIVASLKHANSLQLVKHDNYNMKFYDLYYSECPFAVMTIANTDDHPQRMKDDVYKSKIIDISKQAKAVFDSKQAELLLPELTNNTGVDLKYFALPDGMSLSEMKIVKDPALGDRFIQCSAIAKQLVNDMKGVQLYKLVTGLHYLNKNTFACNVIISPPVAFENLRQLDTNDEYEEEYRKIDEKISINNGKSVQIDVSNQEKKAAESSSSNSPLPETKKNIDMKILQPFQQCQAYSIVCILNFRVLLCDWGTLRALLPKPY